MVTPPYGSNAGGAQQRADEGVGPYAPRGTGERHAGVVVPYGWLRRAAAIALGSGAQRSVCGVVARDG